MEKRKIEVRHPDIDFKGEEIPQHWFNDNPFLTQLVNAFHIVFPPGERFFIRSTRAFMDQLTDKELRKEVKDFMGQEIVHGNEHEKFWDIMRQQGIDVDGFLKFYETTAYEQAEPFFVKLFGKEMALSVTAGLEHYTAMLAEMAFKENIFENMPEDLQYLLKWHAAEEIEHRAVTYDVLKEVDGSYATRMGGYAIASFFLWFYGIGGMAYFLSQDKEFIKKNPVKNLADLFLTIGKVSGTFGKTWIQYLRPDFHPNDVDIDGLADDFFKEMGHRFKQKGRAAVS